MSETYCRRLSKLKRRGVENTSQNASKSIQNGSKMAPRTPLGGPWAPTLLPEPSRSRPGEALGGPGAPEKIVVGGLGASWGEKLVDFTLPEAPREGPGGALGGYFGRIFPAGPPGTEKVGTTINF